MSEKPTRKQMLVRFLKSFGFFNLWIGSMIVALNAFTGAINEAGGGDGGSLFGDSPVWWLMVGLGVFSLLFAWLLSPRDEDGKVVWPTDDCQPKDANGPA